MAPSLHDVPFEVLGLIASKFEQAQTVYYFSLTCKRFHDFCEAHGYQVFVKSNFPSDHPPPFWREAAHALTTSARNWGTKGFETRPVQQPIGADCYSETPGADPTEYSPPRRFSSQSMGYRPVGLDCFEYWPESKWGSRTEVLAWGAGATVVVRIRGSGATALRSPSQKNALPQADATKWAILRETTHQEGRDDITALSLYRDWQFAPDLGVQMIVGRASGALESIVWDREGKRIAAFETSGQEVRATDLNGLQRPLLAVCFSEALAVYPAHLQPEDHSDSTARLQPIVEVADPAGLQTTKFLSYECLAVGRRTSTNPLHLYQLHPSGGSLQQIRRIESEGPPTSIYAISTVPPSSAGTGSRPGDVFLSGWYSGQVRLHDTRSPDPWVSNFEDPIDPAAIYSLASFARERVVAAAARERMLKVFDLRMPGSRGYRPQNLDYTLYLPRDRRARAIRSSSVYSVAAASSFAPSFYVGVEDSVLQIDLVGALDRFPDRSYTQLASIGRGASAEERRPQYSAGGLPGTILVESQGDRRGSAQDILGLGLVEHASDRRGLRMFKQNTSGPWPVGSNHGLDVRWIMNSWVQRAIRRVWPVQ